METNYEVIEILLPEEAEVVTYDDLIDHHHQELVVTERLTPALLG